MSTIFTKACLLRLKSFERFIILSVSDSLDCDNLTGKAKRLRADVVLLSTAATNVFSVLR